MFRQKRMLCCLLAAIILISGVCFDGFRADSAFISAGASVSAHLSQDSTLPRLTELDNIWLISRTVQPSHPEGGGQQQEVQPQQQPSLCGSVLTVEFLNSQCWIGPTLRRRYQEILRGVSWSFIVSYIQCQGGTVSGTITDII